MVVARDAKNAFDSVNWSLAWKAPGTISVRVSERFGMTPMVDLRRKLSRRVSHRLLTRLLVVDHHCVRFGVGRECC